MVVINAHNLISKISFSQLLLVKIFGFSFIDQLFYLSIFQVGKQPKQLISVSYSIQAQCGTNQVKYRTAMSPLRLYHLQYIFVDKRYVEGFVLYLSKGNPSVEYSNYEPLSHLTSLNNL